MSSPGNIKRRIKRAEQKASERQQYSRAVPTAAELWRHLLEDAVDRARQYPATGHLQAHQDSLQTREDVRAASDDVLLEASGFPDVARWGWLRLMVRDLTWFCMLANNWNLPHITFYDCDAGNTTEAERRAFAARQFCELMKLRGHDPRNDALVVVRKLMEQADKMEQANTTEAELIECLCERNEWFRFVFTCESVVIRPEVLRQGNARGRVLYSPEARSGYLAEMRRA